MNQPKFYSDILLATKVRGVTVGSRPAAGSVEESCVTMLHRIGSDDPKLLLGLLLDLRVAYDLRTPAIVPFVLRHQDTYRHLWRDYYVGLPVAVRLHISRLGPAMAAFLAACGCVFDDGSRVGLFLHVPISGDPRLN